LGLVRHIAAEGGIVFAAVRSPPTAIALQELQASSPEDRIHIVQLDVTDTQSIQAAVDMIQGILQGQGLDYLINNAGKSTASADAPSMLDPEVMLDVFKTNVVGPAMIFKTCIPLLGRSKRKRWTSRCECREWQRQYIICTRQSESLAAWLICYELFRQQGCFEYADGETSQREAEYDYFRPHSRMGQDRYGW